MTPARRKQLAVQRRLYALRKRAAYAPKGAKATALGRLKDYVTNLLRIEVRKHG